MMLGIFILLTLIVILGYYYSRDLFAPFVISPLSWWFIVFLYLLTEQYTFKISHIFPSCFVIWILGFSLSSFIVSCTTHTASQSAQTFEPNKKAIYAYALVVSIAIPLMSIALIYKAYTTEPETMFRYLRIMNTGLDPNIQPPVFMKIVSYFIPLCFVSLFLSQIYIKNKYLTFWLLLVNLLTAVVSVSKLNFLSIFFTLLYVLYAQRKIQIRHFIIGGAVFVVFCIGLQIIRSGSDDTSNFSVSDFLTMYLLSSCGAFDYNAVACSATHFGENTFRFLYAVSHAFGGKVEPIQTILPFVGTPSYTNTYTCLYPFYTDFGQLGILIFSIVYGLIYGYLYKKSKSNGQVSKVLYTILLGNIILGFFAELIFTNFSLQLQYIFWTCLPFILNIKINNEKQN